MAETSPVRSQLLLAPNQLTLLRFVFIPFIVINILEQSWMTAILLFVAAGLSDMLDGFVARLLKQKTTIGQYLDPIADKLLLSTLFIVLSSTGHIAWRYTVLVFTRDICILVTAAVLYAAASLRDFRPSVIGKANTVAEIGAVFFVMLYQVYSISWLFKAQKFFLLATMVLTIASAIHYILLTSRRLAELHNAPRQS